MLVDILATLARTSCEYCLVGIVSGFEDCKESSSPFNSTNSREEFQIVAIERSASQTDLRSSVEIGALNGVMMLEESSINCRATS